MDANELVLRAQAQLTTEIDGISISKEKLYAMIPRAIYGVIEYLKKSGKDADLADFFAEHTVPVTAGVANLVTASDLGLRLDLLSMANIRITYANSPEIKTVRVVNSLDRLTLGSIQDFLFVQAYLDGKKLIFSDGTSGAVDPTASLTTSIVINGVTQPAIVTNLSNSLLPAIQQALVDVAKTELPKRAKGTNISAVKV